MGNSKVQFILFLEISKSEQRCQTLKVCLPWKGGLILRLSIF